MPWTPRAISGSWAGVKSWTEVTVNAASSLHLEVGERRVAELGERVVAHVEHPPGDVLVAGDGEVPGEIEVLPLDPGLFSVLKMLLEALALRVDRRLARGQVVAVVAEAVRGAGSRRPRRP